MKNIIINLFHYIIDLYTSVEKILERFYNLENLHNFISNKEKKIKKVKILKLKEKNILFKNNIERKIIKIKSNILRNSNKEIIENNENIENK